MARHKRRFSAKQRAAAKRNIKKALAALRSKKKKHPRNPRKRKRHGLRRLKIKIPVFFKTKKRKHRAKRHNVKGYRPSDIPAAAAALAGVGMLYGTLVNPSNQSFSYNPNPPTGGTTTSGGGSGLSTGGGGGTSGGTYNVNPKITLLSPQSVQYPVGNTISLTATGLTPNGSVTVTDETLPSQTTASLYTGQADNQGNFSISNVPLAAQGNSTSIFVGITDNTTGKQSGAVLISVTGGNSTSTSGQQGPLPPAQAQQGNYLNSPQKLQLSTSFQAQGNPVFVNGDMIYGVNVPYPQPAQPNVIIYFAKDSAFNNIVGSFSVPVVPYSPTAGFSPPDANSGATYNIYRNVNNLVVLAQEIGDVAANYVTALGNGYIIAIDTANNLRSNITTF